MSTSSLKAAVRVVALGADRFDRAVPPVTDDELRDLSDILRASDVIFVAAYLADHFGQPAFEALLSLSERIDERPGRQS